MTDDALTQLLLTQITPERAARFEEVLANRTEHLSVALEDIFQGHNAAAVLRSCECFGVQHIHCIESRNKFKPNDEVSMGAAKWLELHPYKSTADCVTELKSSGHQIVAMTLRAGSIPLAEVPLTRPTVLLFGSEEQGLSELAHQSADIFAHLPMYGFTQSFNISVSVALSLQTLMPVLRQSPQWENMKLSQPKIDALRLEWIKLSVPHWQKIAEHAENKNA